MIVSHGIDSSMVHRRQCSFWESSRFDCSEAACRIRPFGVDTRQSHGNTVQLMNPASFLILLGLPMLFVIAIMVLVIAMKRFVVSRWRRYREEREGEARRTVEPP